MREAYNLFNEISDKLFGPEVFKGDRDGEEKPEEEEADDDDEEEDIDAAFEKEKSELNAMRKKTVSGERRFQVLVQFGLKSFIGFNSRLLRAAPGTAFSSKPPSRNLTNLSLN